MRCSLKKGFVTVCLFSLFVVFCGFNTFLSDDYHLQQKQKTDNKTQIVQETNGLLLMLIISAPFHINERQVVRQTWQGRLAREKTKEKTFYAYKLPEAEPKEIFTLKYSYV